MRHNVKRWVMAVGLSVMALAAFACTDIAPSTSPDDAANGSPTAAATNQPVSNPTQATATAEALAGLKPLTPAEIVQAQEQHFVSIYQDVVPSVVRITTVVGAAGGGEGSGWVWDTDGHIVTNYHVIQGARIITVFFANGREYDAAIVGTDPDSDLAVVKIDAPGLVPATVGDSSTLKAGQTTIAIGNPFGQDFTMTTGIVSAVGRAIDSGFTAFAIPSVIQTDAAINPGNSGGPLLDSAGRVIGINTQIRSQSGQSSGVGFAVPVDLVKRVVPSLIADGRHEYAYLGVTMRTVNNTYRQRLNLPSDLRGVYLATIVNGSPANNAGLLADSGTDATPRFDGDVIVSLNGTPISTTEDLIAYLAIYTSPGEDVVVEVYRGGQLTTLVVTLGARNSVTS